ncbi:MAG: phenylacetate-CoA oxygenase subunit PaaJ [Flavobacteriia bacterium]|nr:phenylacetate-CoA oxygenase subunit PaaJ [Flavobacteriia bacterium]
MVVIEDIWKELEEVKDPEIPVLSIVDLGIVSSVQLDSTRIVVQIIPTYTSCPAMNVIKNEITKLLSEIGEVEVKIVLSPKWTSDLITEKGKKILKEYGISPPNSDFNQEVECPRCNSKDTFLVSNFGSTACKAHYKCKQCLEPFDYFKCHK